MQDIIDKIIEKLKLSFGDEIKQYYQGDPIAVPAANLPCIYVEGDGTDISAGATGTDELVHTVGIGIIIDKRGEINRNADENVSHRRLIELTQKRDTSGNFASNSIIGILRTNFTLSNTINDQTLRTEYGIRERGEIITAEARITARISELVVVPSRT